MKIRLSSLAERQLLEGHRFYESRAEGLGNYFLDSIMADVDSLRIHAGVHVVLFGSYHRLLARRFPYSVYYRIEGKEIGVYAIFDNRRNPEQIRRHLVGREKQEDGEQT